MKDIRECFADRLQSAGDTVGATLSRAGFAIKKNKMRDTCLGAAAKETDSVKLLVAAKIFSE